MMELALSIAIGLLVAAGTWLTLRARSFDVVLGLTLLSYAINLAIFAMGRLAPGKPPLVREGTAGALATHTDPLPQALVLTAIVISFAMTAVLLAIAVRSRAANRSDHVDGGGRDEP
jgi:multicomponent K+:H+ antiporter subunit C